MDKDKAVSFVNDLLKTMVDREGSDLYLTAGAPPSVKIDGRLTPLTNQPLTENHSTVLIRSLMNEKQLTEFERDQECNFAISVPGLSRFRCSAFTQRGCQGIVIRTISTTIPKFEDLDLPAVLKDIALTKRGLVIFVGATGSGKSTSLAAMIGYRNEQSYGHIITIEDPIEFIHPHINCVITQREVGVDTDSYEVALKNTLRQAPDVILLGEVRDRETMDYAIAFAETGHLCLTTLHANSTNQALDRIINFFPDERRHQLLMDLSLNLKSIISQRLIPKADGEGRKAAMEILINTPRMADLIFKGEVSEMKELIKSSNEQGMQTFDQSLFELLQRGEITYQDALRNADSMNDLRLRVKLEGDISVGDLLGGAEELSVETADDDNAGFSVT